jgi:hypothetical protein
VGFRSILYTRKKAQKLKLQSFVKLTPIHPFFMDKQQKNPSQKKRIQRQAIKIVAAFPLGEVFINN